jgi:hypothetical protein
VAPLAAERERIELFIGWLQEIRHFKPATAARAAASSASPRSDG